MSLTKRADVKNHLSAHHRTEIHLTRPYCNSEATGFPHEESVGADPQNGGLVENPPNIPTPNEPETAPFIISKRVQAG
jgi:hypothetical protein